MANYCAGNIARRSAAPKLGEGWRPLSRSLDLFFLRFFFSEEQWGRGDNGQGAVQIFFKCVFFKQKKIKGGSTLNLLILQLFVLFPKKEKWARPRVAMFKP